MKEKLLKKLFNNSCSEEDLITFFQLIQDDPTPPSPKVMKKLFEDIQAHPAPQEETKDKIFSNILTRIEDAPVLVHPGASQLKKLKPAYYWLVASLALLLTLGFWIYGDMRGELVVRTEYGEQHAVEFSDGSKVRLNANSQLVYDKSWDPDESRAVRLEGEAFFEVKKKSAANQKFQVITKDLIVEVLGTSFNVNSHHGKTSVYLEEGNIRLHLNHLDTMILMDAGDLIVYSENSGLLERKNGVSKEYHTSWKDGVLRFTNAPLRLVLEKIEETYGVHFTVTDESYYEREINYPLPTNDLETAISILKKTVEGLEVKRDSDPLYME
jgi:ferric-dicitrate binding protein FerR (iron transport regulator)